MSANKKQFLNHMIQVCEEMIVEAFADIDIWWDRAAEARKAGKEYAAIRATEYAVDSERKLKYYQKEKKRHEQSLKSYI